MARVVELVLTGVRDLALDGWTHEPTTSATLTSGSALLTGARHRIAFGTTPCGSNSSAAT
ncbi:hypothetical protein ACFWOG_18545 [Kitasatospora sp. NPDC058406]|uniref:hypothetical protein n=1 Tax=Kitasatospora sp. NPDC058406 TaxID=3346483 RepID=UPI003661D054